MDTTPRPPLSGRYELVHLVARGGMAEVYRAHDRLLDRPVAVKVLFPELSVDRNFVERFRREAQAAANLSHPHIVPVFDWGEDNGTYFIVMEFIDGRPLSSILRTAGPLHPDRAAEIAADVALALDYAHRHGVIHRDIKPGNVLITDEGQVKVTDFGIARAVNTDESLTQTGAVMGTATYFSPEQAEGLGVDARSDIYSLGVVIYEMVAGRPPFTGDSPVSVASKHVREQAPAPRTFNPSVPPDLEAIILKCMAKSPDYRYATGADLRVDLLRFHEGRAVGAGPVPSGANVLPSHTQALPSVQAAYPPPEEEEPSRTGLYVAILIVLLIALAVVVAFLGNTLGWWHLGSSTQSTFALTDVTGKKASAAETTLRAKGLVPGIHNQSSTAAQEGFVISTNPGPGTQVHKGQNITLDVGSGPSTVMVLVPNVEGFAVKDAEAVLTNDGFKPLTVASSCPPTPNGDVCNETPEPNTEAKKGSTVTLYVSNVTPPTTTTTTQPQSHVVPNVAQDTVQAACAAIASQGLICAQSSEYIFQYNPTVPSGLVITTQPIPGSQENANTSVILVISKGPAPLNVPDVLGDTQQAATSSLMSQGFSPVTKLDHSDKNQADCGIVTKQDPVPNTPAPPNSTVTITVGDGQECNGTGGSPPTTAAIIFGSGSQYFYPGAVRREYV